MDMDPKIPADSKSRRYTDKKGFLIYGCALVLCLLCLIPFIKEKSDIRRIFYGTDKCGNFCGIKNNKIDNVGCSGKDYSSKPYSDLKQCVELCPWGTIMGSYTCSQKAINRVSVSMTDFYVKKIKEEEEGRTQANAEDELEREREESQRRELEKEMQRKALEALDEQRRQERRREEIEKRQREEWEKRRPTQTEKPKIHDMYPFDCLNTLNEKGRDTVQERLKCFNVTIPGFNFDRIRRSIIKEENTFISDPFEDCRRSWWKFLIIIIITIVLSIFIIWITREVPPLPIWCCCACAFFITVFLTYSSWRLYTESATIEARSKGRIIVPVLTSLFCVFSFFTPFVLCKRLNVLVLLFAETAKIITGFPKLLILIVMIAVAQFVVLILFILEAVQIMTTTELKMITWDYYEFGEQSPFAILALILIIFVTNWTMQIFVGFQWVTVSGTVALWYFEGNPQRKSSYVFKSFSRTLYHLGTIAYGSLLQPWVTFVNHCLRFFSCDYGHNRQCDGCFCEGLTKAQIRLECYSKNAFINTALHGYPFYLSGKRAFNMLLTHAPGVIAINKMGNAFVLISEFNVIVITTAISYALFMDSGNVWMPTTICFIASSVIITALFRTFQITMNTLSICFCEDIAMGDGSLRPYLASNKLKEFMERVEELYVKRQTSAEMCYDG